MQPNSGQPNSFVSWMQQKMQAPPATPNQDELQLAATQQHQALAPIIHQTLRNANLYLPQPQTPGYLAPTSHSRIQTHQTPLTQSALTTTPNVTSKYLLPPPGQQPNG